MSYSNFTPSSGQSMQYQADPSSNMYYQDPHGSPSMNHQRSYIISGNPNQANTSQGFYQPQNTNVTQARSFQMSPQPSTNQQYQTYQNNQPMRVMSPNPQAYSQMNPNPQAYSQMSPQPSNQGPIIIGQQPYQQQVTQLNNNMNNMRINPTPMQGQMIQNSMNNGSGPIYHQPQAINNYQPPQNSPSPYNPSQNQPQSHMGYNPPQSYQQPQSPMGYNPPQTYQQPQMRQPPHQPQTTNSISQPQVYRPSPSPQTSQPVPNSHQGPQPMQPYQEPTYGPGNFSPNPHGPLMAQSTPQQVQPKSFVIQPNQPERQNTPQPHQPANGNYPQNNMPKAPTAPTVPHHAPQQEAKQFKMREMPSSKRNSLSFDNTSEFTESPQFVSHPKSHININEGDSCSLTAKVKPAGDSSLQVEWYKNGNSISASSRYNCTFDRGYAVLEFLYTIEDDTGEYYCMAKNKMGSHESTTCKIKVIPGSGVITETQLPEDSMIENLEAMEQYRENMGHPLTREEEQSNAPPTFVRDLQGMKTIPENSPVHFECIIEPSTDSNLTVDWFKDENPVTMGCRYNATLDRGFAIFDILYCYSEDSGIYHCVARNKFGEVRSSPIQLFCQPEGSIITKSCLSKDSIAYLENLDNYNSDIHVGFYDRPAPEDSEEQRAPSFVIEPEPIVALEGTPARFLVKADGWPRPKVHWYINGDIIASSGAGGNWRIFQDGGISYLEFHRCSNPGLYEVTIVAKNSLGEATTHTKFEVTHQPDYRPGLKHVMPENPFKKMLGYKKVDCTDELISKMRKPKAQAIDLRKIERYSEHKGRYNNENEVAETENLYATIQKNLKTGRASLPPAPATENHPSRPSPPKEPEILTNQINKSKKFDPKPQNVSQPNNSPSNPMPQAMNKPQANQPQQMFNPNQVAQNKPQQPTQMGQNMNQGQVAQNNPQQQAQMGQNVIQNQVAQNKPQQPTQMGQNMNQGQVAQNNPQQQAQMGFNPAMQNNPQQQAQMGQNVIQNQVVQNNPQHQAQMGFNPAMQIAPNMNLQTQPIMGQPINQNQLNLHQPVVEQSIDQHSYEECLDTQEMIPEQLQ